MSKLPFKISKKSDIETVSDGQGNTLDIPKYGCLTPREKIDYTDCKYNLSTTTDITPVQYEIKTVARFLSLRFDTELSEEELIEQAGSFDLIHAIYQFLDNEDRKWEARNLQLEVEGNDAKEVVFNYITQNSENISVAEFPVAATREDLLIFKRWVVFASIDYVPMGYTAYRWNPKTNSVGKLQDGGEPKG